MATREWSVMRVGDDADLVVIDDSVFDLDDPVKVCTVHSDARSGFTVESNASLIAAAPDLLSACEEAFEEFSKNKYGSGGCPQLSKLHAAIAKAKGA